MNNINDKINTNDTMNSNIPEPKKIGVWAEGTHIEAKEFIMAKKSAESIDDIPSIPDLDDFSDILEKDVAKPPVLEQHNVETVKTLAEVGGVRNSVEGIDAALEVLKSYIPKVESDNVDTVWTVDSLLTQLLEMDRDLST